VQIRLVLKPIKDRLGVVLRQVDKSSNLLNEQLNAGDRARVAEGLDYLEANLTLLGLWV
jgi:hypothetical protein